MGIFSFKMKVVLIVSLLPVISCRVNQAKKLIGELNHYFHFDHNIFVKELSADIVRYMDTESETPQTIYVFNDVQEDNTADKIVFNEVSIIERLLGMARKSELNQLRIETEKLFKDTEGQLDCLVLSNDDRILKRQKNRLLDEFVEAKTAFLKLRRRIDDD